MTSAVQAAFSPQEIQDHLTKVTGWSLAEDGKSISKSFQFKDFSACWSVMSRIALKAEEIGHHPEWFNVYNKLDVRLSTHDLGGLSALDFELALAIDLFASGHGS